MMNLKILNSIQLMHDESKLTNILFSVVVHQLKPRWSSQLHPNIQGKRSSISRGGLMVLAIIYCYVYVNLHEEVNHTSKTYNISDISMKQYIYQNIPADQELLTN